MQHSPHIHTVEALDLPGLLPYRTLRRPEDHIRQGIFVAEGEKVVRRLLASDLHVVSLLLTEEWYERLRATADLPAGIDIYLAGKSLLESIVGYRVHQGIMALGKVPVDIDPQDLPEGHLLVALDALSHAENVGLMVRNSAAFGVDAMITGETCCSPYVRRAVRNSMGAVFQMPVMHTEGMVETLRSLRHRFQTKVIAAHLDAGTSLHDAGLRGNLCIVFGNEESGVRRDVLSVCDQVVAIPMKKGTDSLNVASASAVFLYEASRRRSP